MLRKLLTLAAAAFALPAWAEVALPVTYLKLEVPRPPVLSNLDPVPDDLGEAGAQLGLADNQTTGKFLGHDYSLTVTRVPEGGDWLAAARAALAESPFLILDAPAQAQLELADLPEAEGAVLFNATAADAALRDESCRANLLHSLPSEAMRADALMQFLVKRRWTDLVMIAGDHPGDKAFAEAMRRSITKFGLTLKAEKTWVFDADMRRNASQEVPLFTQDFGDYDMLLVADELGDFGRYIAFNTWQARPVAGSEGLKPVAWSWVVEQWGAAQMQNRFEELAGRDMRSEDYAAWAAIRSLGEAVTRTQSADAATLRAYILSDDFELAGFKGRKMSFRNWNGQLRQPIPLVTPRAVVAKAPLEGFLHQRTELDTLGIDQGETKCTAFQE
ncbi:ABC transporter substrate-binding protein [uncultured Roseovarius sp.]|uniref:ABC transporter substrate-binding protein n=1 Tax=uncultured Roseovarius sp. TaxID=293344 RepID=UPI0025DA0913|nr:ABC transporter substrate-binding protein [uncultured Roseovarius sp.]